MPMGLTNAGATYQAMMEEILAQFLFKCVVVYLDDVFIYSNTKEEHERHAREVFEILHAAGLKTRPDKTQLFQRSLKCLGFMVMPEGLRRLANGVDKIKTLDPEHTLKSIQSFLGIILQR